MDFFLQPELYIKIILILCITAGTAYGAKRMLSNFKDLSPDHMWLKALGDSMYRPSTWVIWSIGVILSLDTLLRSESCPLPNAPFQTVKQLIFVAVFTWLILIWKGTIEKILMDRALKKESPATDKELISVFGKLISIIIFVIAGFIILDIFDVPLQALLAFGGIGSLAISWAAKDVIANFFGGMMIFINRPFAIGDWIKSPNKNFEGIVEYIGWYMTRIRTFERRPTFIPNSLVTDAIIENPGRMYNRQLKATIGLRYKDIQRVKKVVSDIKKMLREHPEIDQNQLLFVDFQEFNAYSLDINIYSFTKTTKWGKYRSIKQDVLLKIADIIKENGAEIAFPTNTVHLHKQEP
ncbi:MAG: mechanosensitive ion channel family protein [Chlamydiota bacterium]|nr:mechanosensitive ion channel family protein [Chlamydiota bacterium]